MKQRVPNRLSISEFEFVKVDLPHASWVFRLGIFSVIFFFAGGILGLLAGILALKLYKKPYKLYTVAPELYNKSSFRNIKAGKILAIFGIVLSTIVFLVFLIILILVGVFHLHF
jgi:hypothetical protein